MRRKTFLKLLCMLMFILLLAPLSRVMAAPAEKLIGQETLYFTLPSTEDRTVNYLQDYYGKYHLIMTFFPAAFTPI